MDKESSGIVAEVTAVIPHNKREAGTLISRIGHLLLAVTKSNSRYNKRIAKLKQKASKLEEERKEFAESKFGEAKVLSTLVVGFALPLFDMLRRKGTRTVPLGTGELRLRDVGKPTIEIADKEAFYAEVRKRRCATRFIRWTMAPNTQALHDDLELARSFKTVNIIGVTKVEIRPKHSDVYVQSPQAEELTWEIVDPNKKK